jgi:putative two-component system response regulator
VTGVTSHLDTTAASIENIIPFNRKQKNERRRESSSLFRIARPSKGGSMSSITSLKGIILVADDDENVREPLVELLRLNCYRVIAVENGEQAFKEACSQPVDLVLLDVMMPGPTGFSVCRAIKIRPETRFVPVVLITGLASAEDRIRGIEAGADDFLLKPVKKEELLARVRSLVRLKRYTDELENAETVLCTLARSIEAKDPYTEGHCDRLSRSAVSLAEKVGLSREDCNDLRRSGIVHDIGKVAVPEFVLLKPGPLDAAERKIMEEHTIIGERICAPMKSFHNVLPIIRWHHEKQDGSGYPDHLKGEEIPITARILQTVDIYDSLTTDRPYRKALSQEKALEIMWEETRRGWWDADLVSALEGLLTESPLELSAASA